MPIDLSILNPKARPLIGLDISSSAVKMVELSDAGKGAFRIERYTIEPLPREAVADGNIVNLEAVAEAIKRAPPTSSAESCCSTISGRPPTCPGCRATTPTRCTATRSRR